MRKILSALAATALLGVAATPAAAAITAGSLNGTGGSTLTFIDLTVGSPSLDLTNNGAYKSNSTAYLFYEGVNDSGQDTFLLHFDRSGRASSVGTVEGSFVFSLEDLDTFDAVWTTKAELDGSDDLNNGVTYDRCTNFVACLFDPAAVFRGLEPPITPIFGDFVWITPTIASDNSAPVYTVSYRFTNDGATMDEVRFGFTNRGPGAVVPEPSTWALMIGGFGLAGAALRRRRAVAATA